MDSLVFVHGQLVIDVCPWRVWNSLVSFPEQLAGDSQMSVPGGQLRIA